MRAPAIAAVLVAVGSAAQAACPQALAVYADADRTMTLEFRPSGGEAATVTNMFRVVMENDVVLDGIDGRARVALERRAVDALVAGGAGPVTVRRHVVASTSADAPTASADAALLRSAAAELRTTSPVEAADLLVVADGLLPADDPTRDAVLRERVEAELRVGRLADAAAGAAVGLARADDGDRDAPDVRRRQVAFHRLAAEAHLEGERAGMGGEGMLLARRRRAVHLHDRPAAGEAGIAHGQLRPDLDARAQLRQRLVDPVRRAGPPAVEACEAAVAHALEPQDRHPAHDGGEMRRRRVLAGVLQEPRRPDQEDQHLGEILRRPARGRALHVDERLGEQAELDHRQPVAGIGQGDA